MSEKKNLTPAQPKELEIIFTTEVAPHEMGNPKALAHEVKQLIDQGLSVEEAAKKLGLDLRRNKELRGQMRRLVAEVGTIPALVQRELVRQARMKLLLGNVHSDDPDAQKIALQAAKQIASDPEVGLNAPPAIVALVDMESLNQIFNKLPDEDDILEAEFEEVSNGTTDPGKD